MTIIATLQDARRPRCVDSQFPVDPRATHGAPRRDARASASSTFDETLTVESSASLRRLAIPRRSPCYARGPAPGGSRLGLLYDQRNISYRVVGLKRRLAIPRRSPCCARGPAPGGSRRYSQFSADPAARVAGDGRRHASRLRIYARRACEHLGWCRSESRRRRGRRTNRW